MSEKITFSELVELIAKQSEQSESSANSFIRELVQVIEGGLKQSGSVSISGFGKFELRWMKERAGVNPQTGEKITVPGQNKVVFKPFKALRETVNKPFANLKTEVLDEKSTPDESDTENRDDPLGLNAVLNSDDPFEEDDKDQFGKEKIEPFGSPTPFEPIPYREESRSVDDLIIERENPFFDREHAEDVETLGDAFALEEEEKQQEVQKVAPILPDEPTMAQEVQKSGNFRWSYAAAVIIVMLALILLFFMMQRSGENLEETALTPGQAEQQTIQPSTSAENAGEESAAAGEQSTAATESGASQPSAAESSQSSGSEEGEAAADEELHTESNSSPAQAELETQAFTVEDGQSLWDIAENELGNPYLWPVIYHLNQDALSNPNQLLAGSDIDIPTFSDPDTLNESEREQVALGYFSLYQWNRENNPEEARYFLWAVGVFSMDLLDHPPSEVDSQDLAFARNR